MTADMEATIICGTNRRLKRELERWYKGTDGLQIVGYTDQIPLYMDASDLYLTKPGGISVTEAAAIALPMAFINAVAGCEQYNLEFFTELGGAVTARTPRELTERCIRLLHAPGELGSMARALRTMPSPDSGERVYQHLHREALVYTLFFDVSSFERMMRFIILSFSAAMLIYILFPNCQELRPVTFERDNIFTRLITGLYQFDTNTNVCPSIHVIGSVAAVVGIWNTRRFSGPGWRCAFLLTAALISVSTVFLKQHSVMDVLAAAAVCGLVLLGCQSWERVFPGSFC